MKVPMTASLAIAIALTAPKEPTPFMAGASATDLFAGAVFSPDRETVYFTKYSAFEVDAVKTIMWSRRTASGWSVPAKAPFSGAWSDTTPFLTHDGRRLYFASNRPVDGKPRTDFDLWFADRTPSGWGTPVHLAAVNGPSNETSPALTSAGVLYFSSWREEGGSGLGDLWRAEPSESGFKTPTNLGTPINGTSGEWGVTVSADETVLVFESSGRAEGLSGAGDLYISRRSNGRWSEPRHLKPPINSDASDLAPRFSPDGTELYFASTRRGHLEMWSVSVSSLQ